MAAKKASSKKKSSKKKSSEKEPFDPEQNIRNCTIVTQLHDPLDKSRKFIVDDIQSVIDKNIGQIKSYAWIKHDRDKILKEDVAYYKEKANQLEPTDPHKKYYEELKLYGKKAEHYHIVISWKNGKTRKEIARWFQCEMTCVRAGVLGEKGRHYNPSIVLYLLHLNTRIKHQYDLSDIHCDSITRAELPNLIEKYKLERKLKGTKSLEVILGEMEDGKTAEQVINDDEVAFQTFVKNEKTIRAAENNYRLYKASRSEYMVNIYIQGGSGTGKTSLAKLLAKRLYPENIYKYFVVGGKNVALQHYAGEKVILWDDITPENLLSFCPSGDIQDFLDPYQQEKKAYNIKNSAVIPMQEVNIFTTTLDYETFFEKIIDETDVVQIYRRMPIILKILDDSIQIGINEGEWEGDPSKWKQYKMMTIARVNVAEVMKKTPVSRLDIVLEGVLEYICTYIKLFKNRILQKNLSAEDEVYEQISQISLERGKDDYISDEEFKRVNQIHVKNSHDTEAIMNFEFAMWNKSEPIDRETRDVLLGIKEKDDET